MEDPAVFIPILLFFLGLAGYYFWEKRKSKTLQVNKDGKEALGGKPVLCRVADNITGRIYNAWIPFEEIEKIIVAHGSLGRQWKRDNKWVYALCKQKDESYAPIIPPNQVKNSPSGLYADMQFPEVSVLMDMRVDQPFLQRYGQVLWWIAVMGFIVFMMVDSSGR